MKDLISVITINYNNAEGLSKTISSVVEQTYSEIEFIVIDGASKDASADVLEASKDKISKLVSEPDTGIYDAMNKGIKLARGEFLLFLNSGDFLTNPKALSDFVAHEKFSGDIIYGDYKFENGEKIYPDTLPPNYFMKTSLPHQSTLFKSDVFDEMGYYDESYKMGADRAFFLKCFVSNKFTFSHVPYLLTKFDLQGISNNPEYLLRKQAEDTRMLKSFYGDKYEIYLAEIEAARKMKRAQKNSIKGIIKRIKNRIFK